MLLKEFTSVLSAKSRDQLLVEVVRFAGRLGFETVDAMIVVDHVRGGPESSYAWTTRQRYTASHLRIWTVGGAIR
jgi:hypothetical protein